MAVSARKIEAPLTIIITSYNYAHYILDAVRSVVEQTSPEWYLVIYDNRSTDNTVELLQPFLADPRIKLIERDENVGARKNFELAIEVVDTEFVSSLQADDFLEPTFVELALKYFRAYPKSPFVFFDWHHFFDDSKTRVPHRSAPFSSSRSGPISISPYLTIANFVPFHMAVFRTKPMQEMFRRMLDSPLAQVGEQFMLKMLQDEHGCGCYSGTLGGCWRRHSTQMTQEHAANSVSLIEEPIERQWYITKTPRPDPATAFLALVALVRQASRTSYSASVDWLLSPTGKRYARSFGIPVDTEGERYLDMALVVALKYFTYTGVVLMDIPSLADWLKRLRCAASPQVMTARLEAVRAREGEPFLTANEITDIIQKLLELKLVTERRLGVLVYSGDEQSLASVQIRLVRPFSYLADGYDLVWGDVNSTGDLNLLADADLVVLQRGYVTKTNKEHIETILGSGRPVVFELDDLTYDLPPDHSDYDKAQPNQAYIRSIIDRVDAVIVPTPALGQELQQSCMPKQVAVLPSLVDVTLFHTPARANKEPIRIVLAGTPGHKGDYAILDEVIERLLKKYPSRLLFVFMGVVPGRWQGNPSVAQFEFIADYTLYAQYLLKCELDIALVPLKDDKYNRCKSNIKWLEYSAAGIAGVYSDIEPYACIRHGETGLKVANTADAWFSAICELVDSPTRRQAIALAAQREVETNYALQKQGHLYAQCYAHLLSLSTMETPVENRDIPDQAKSMRPKPAKFQSFQGQAVDPYRAWLLAHAYQERDAFWIAERIAALAAPPLFHLAVILPEENGEWVLNTIDALANQFYKRWRLTIVAKAPEPESFAGVEVIRWVQVMDETPLRAVNQTLQEVEADWVGMVEAGDRIALHGFFALADKIDRHPEWSALYTDEDSLDDAGNRSTPFFKPDFDLDMLRSASFVMGGVFMLKRDLYRQLGGFRPEMEGVEYYDLQLRAYESAGDAGIGHVADVLYHRFAEGGHCTRGMDELTAARQQAVEDHLARCGLKAEIRPGRLPGTYQLRYLHERQPLVSIVIPTKNQLPMLQRCIDTVVQTTAYQRYEILIVDNGSDEADAVALLNQFKQAKLDRLRVLDYPHPFNFSAMNNLAAREARGEYLLLLNNDTAVIQPDWLDEMLSYAQRPDVGAVGAKLIFPNGRVQHAGVILGMQDRPAEHQFLDSEEDAPGYFGRLHLPQSLSAVTAACMLVRKSLYDEVQGFDEAFFKVDLNDIDLCLKLRAKGYRVVWTPFAVLLHEGSVSQTANVERADDKTRELRRITEQGAMYSKWPREIAFDPAFNRNLSLSSRDYQIELTPMLSLDPEWRPRPRVLAYPSARIEQGERRTAAPMRALNRVGKVLGWETANYLSMPKLFRFDPEIIVFHHQVEPGQVQYLEYCARHSKAFRVFQFDEWLADWQTDSPEKQAFIKAAGLCDRLVVPTEYLAEAYAACAKEVVVVPDYLERARWANHPTPMRRQSEKPRVGWVGVASDEDDLSEIAGAIEATAQEVDWVILGSCPESLRPYVKEHHPSVDTDDYPAKLASLNLDLAVAPLKDTPSNYAKGHSRLLEHGLMGHPVICSKIAAYGNDLPVERVGNRTEDWVQAIRSHVADMKALAARGDALKREVEASWMLEDHLDVWLKAWLP